jgi:hypothetical protein
VFGQKSKELSGIPFVSFDGFAGHPALGHEMRKPTRHLDRHVFGGERRFALSFGLGCA